MKQSRAFAAALAAICGCRQAPSGLAPAVNAVEPPRQAVGREVPVSVRGAGFYAQAVQPLGAGATEIDDRFQAWLVPEGASRVELLQVSRVSEGLLSAVVPAQLPVGAYGIAVQGPYGGASLAAAYTATAQPSAFLSAGASAPPAVSVGRRFEVSLQVRNLGDGAAAAVAPSGAPPVDPAGALELLATPPAQDIAAQSSAAFRFSFMPRAAGPVRLGFAVAGKDALSGAALTASAEASLQVSSAAALSAVATLDTPSVSVGQEAGVQLALANGGDLGAAGLRISVALSNPAIAELSGSEAPASFDLAPGAMVAYAYRFRAKAVGTLTFSFDVAGQEEGSGEALGAQAQTDALTVGSGPALLTVMLAAPASAKPGSTFQVTLSATNALGMGPIRVAPSGDPTMAGEGAARLEQSPDLSAVTLAPGGTGRWTWSYRAQGPGPVTFTAAALGSDLDGGSWSASASRTTIVQSSE